jgi:osmotically-inducible protein OsmY
MKIEDSALRRKVTEELEWEPSVDASQIGVAVKDGIATLTGTVLSYPEKTNAERATRRVAGIKGVADELKIKLFGSDIRSDSDVAQAAVNGLRLNASVPRDDVKVLVGDGWVSLDGEVEWQYQRLAAENTVRNLRGVVGITNRISIKPHVDATNVKSKIESAFARQAHLDANKIQVEAVNSEVTLRGSARSIDEKLAAEAAAWSAPGVTKVRNDVLVNAW